MYATRGGGTALVKTRVKKHSHWGGRVEYDLCYPKNIFDNTLLSYRSRLYRKKKSNNYWADLLVSSDPPAHGSCIFVRTRLYLTPYKRGNTEK